MRVKPPSGPEATLQLTSMIDVVFLLLIFFVMTFKIAAQEGDFSVKMPLQNAGGQPLEPDADLPIKLRLRPTQPAIWQTLSSTITNRLAKTLLNSVIHHADDTGWHLPARVIPKAPKSNSISTISFDMSMSSARSPVSPATAKATK